MGFSNLYMRDLIRASLTGTDIGPVMFLNAGTQQSGAVYIATTAALTAANVEADGLVVNDKIADVKAKLITNSRVKFTAVAFTSSPQVVTGRIYFVTGVTGDKIAISELPGGTPISFTASSGTATISDLLVSETVTIGGLSEPLDAPNAARYEATLGVDRPLWTPEDAIIGFANADANGQLRAIIPRGTRGTLSGLASDVGYSAFALLNGGTATPAASPSAETGALVGIARQASVQTLIAATPNAIIAELSWRPI